MAGIDPLTGLLNRQSYYHDMKDRVGRIRGVASVDMNELKYINDNQGHEAGDRALRCIADILRQSCGSQARAYRVGGDEFMIFYTAAGETEIRASLAAMRRSLAATPYSCAFGYAVKTPEASLSDMIHAADLRMYEDKAAMKEALRERGESLHGRA